ncbi:hypothetical protein [Halostella litorea]|uniref:hypothetical protein n=1 Tax=Halostella litorea TaxID=2528831 RepID=UPI001092179C|nr:hypothetical protein [Halostella litorea]
MTGRVRETVEELEEGDALTLVAGDEDNAQSYRCTVKGVASAGYPYLTIHDHEAFKEVSLRLDDDAYRGVLADFQRVDELGQEPTEDVLDVTLQ